MCEYRVNVPRPPRPCTATISPGVMCMLRTPLNRVTPAQRRGAAETGSMSLGMRTAASERSVQYSASTRDQYTKYLTSTLHNVSFESNLHPPSREIPLMASLLHIWKLPRLHCLHVPSCPPCQGPPTRSPSDHLSTPSPSLTMSPTTSWPGMRGLQRGMISGITELTIEVRALRTTCHRIHQSRTYCRSDRHHRR